MPMDTRHTAEGLTRPVEDPVKIVQENMAGQSPAAMTEHAGKGRPERLEENTSKVYSNKAQSLAAVESAWNERKGSASRAQFQKTSYGLARNSF